LKVNFKQDKAYHVDMDSEEIEELAKGLGGELESAGLEKTRSSRDEEDEGSTTEEDLWVNAQASWVGEEEDEDSDEDKENEEGSQPEENMEENQEYYQWDIGYKKRLGKWLRGYKTGMGKMRGSRTGV